MLSALSVNAQTEQATRDTVLVMSYSGVPGFWVTRPVIEDYHAVRTAIIPGLERIILTYSGLAISDSLTIIAQSRQIEQLVLRVGTGDRISKELSGQVSEWRTLNGKTLKMYRREKLLRKILTGSAPLLIAGGILIGASL